MEALERASTLLPQLAPGASSEDPAGSDRFWHDRRDRPSQLVNAIKLQLDAVYSIRPLKWPFDPWQSHYYVAAALVLLQCLPCLVDWSFRCLTLCYV